MRSGFFNSDITGYDENNLPIFDRAEDAEFFSKFFSSIIGNGVYPNPSTNFQVISNVGMTVKVLQGLGFIEGYFAFEDVDRVLTVQAAHSTLDRIDRVVLRLNLATRYIDLYIKTGIAIAAPNAPDLTRPVDGGGDIYELAIADLFIAKNVTTVSQERITDTRMNNELCGIVHGVIEQIDTTSLFIQLKNQIDSNMELIQGALDETLAGDIISKLTKDLSKLIVPTTAVWTQLTAETAMPEELENDPDLTNSWITDIAFNCSANDYLELQPNVPTGELGLANYCKSSNGQVRIYASDNSTGKELKFMICRKTKRNEVA